jgi:hypothetical protein
MGASTRPTLPTCGWGQNRMRRRVTMYCVAAAAAVLFAGCGEGADEGTRTAQEDAKVPAASEAVAPSHCLPGHPACRETVGRIVYVERVDPDGDGDAHFVIRDPQGITLPGLTAIDVRKGLRPHPLPGPGDLISAAGPVQTGSYGQHQIHALELHVAS